MHEEVSMQMLITPCSMALDGLFCLLCCSFVVQDMAMVE